MNSELQLGKLCRANFDIFFIFFKYIYQLFLYFVNKKVSKKRLWGFLSGKAPQSASILF